MVLTEQGAV